MGIERVQGPGQSIFLGGNKNEHLNPVYSAVYESQLAELEAAARQVVRRWESGDLASAVRRLDRALGPDEE